MNISKLIAKFILASLVFSSMQGPILAVGDGIIKDTIISLVRKVEPLKPVMEQIPAIGFALLALGAWLDPERNGDLIIPACTAGVAALLGFLAYKGWLKDSE